MKEKIARAFALLEKIPVSGPAVDVMYEVRVLLAQAHNELKEKEAEKDG